MCPYDTDKHARGGLVTMDYKGHSPQIHSSCFIAEGAKVIGRVLLKENASVWFNAVLRGDVDKIIVGKNTNIQDGAIVHCDKGSPTEIGNNVTIGHNSIIHGCIIEENCLIGMGSIIMNGAQIGKNSIVAAGTLIPQGKVIPDHSLVMGHPGQIVRKITPRDIEDMEKNNREYITLQRDYKKESE